MKIGSNLLVGLVLTLGIGMIHAGPDGAPPEACTTMAPEYEVDAQEGPCPFEIVALQNLTYIGESIQVRIASKDPSSDLFEEFIVMAFNAADDNNYSPLGSFQIPEESANDAKMMDCPDLTEDIGVTNSNGDPKESLDFVWTAPKDFVGTVIIKATFVQNPTTFWLKENTKFITVTPDPGVTTTSSTTSTRAPTSPTTTTTRGPKTTKSTTTPIPTIPTVSTSNTQGTTSVASHLVRKPIIIILITLIGFSSFFL